MYTETVRLQNLFLSLRSDIGDGGVPAYLDAALLLGLVGDLLHEFPGDILLDSMVTQVTVSEEHHHHEEHDDD